jgi:hypothetical protein
MVEIDPGLDTRLRAFYDRYESEAMPSRLATFDHEAEPKRRAATQFVAGAIGVGVIVAAVVVFAAELTGHNQPGPAGRAPGTQYGLPELGASPPLPAHYQILVPVTVEKGSATLPSFTPLEHYSIDFSCIGPGRAELVGTDGTVIDSADCSSPHGTVSMTTWIYSSDQVLGSPLAIRVLVDRSSVWEILIVESAVDNGSPPQSLPAAFDTFTAPPGATTLIAATKGTGTVTLPRFDPTERYYIVSTCTGGGSMVITSQPAEGGPGSSSCLSPGLNTGANDFLGPADEVTGEPLTLTVSAPWSTSWEILVYETNQPDGA